MKLYVLDNGHLVTDKSSAIASPGPLNEQIKMPISAYLIDTGSGWILFDTGCHPKAMEGHWSELLRNVYPYFYTPEQTLESQLALCGVTPKDIKTVVLSHLHMDHAGGLYLFEHADVYVPAEDYRFAQKVLFSSPEQTAYSGYIKADLDVPVKQYHLVEEDFTLAPGVEVINLPGHTVGLLGLVVHLEGGTYILPQDCLYTAENYGPPMKLSGLLADQEAFCRSVDKVRALEEKYHAKVMFAHDWDFTQSLKLAPACYE